MKNDQIKYIPVTGEDRAFFIHVHHTAYRDAIEKMFGWDEVLQDRYANHAFDEGGMNIIWHKGKRIGVFGWEGRNYLRVLTLKDDHRAKKLYERHGFEVTEANDLHWNMVRQYIREDLSE